MKSVLKQMFGDLDVWGKVWLYLGLVALAAAAWMTFSVGWNMTPAHALFLAVLSFITAFIPHGSFQQWEQGRRGVAVMIALLSVPLFAIEFFQHAAYTAGIRGNDIAETRVQNTRYDATIAAEKEEKAAYDMMAARFADLNAKNGWAATVTADALRAKLPGLELAIQLESKRGGCKQLCETRTKERDEINSRIAVLEERSDLQRKLEAARSYLDKRREKVATTEHKSSIVEHMNGFLTKNVAMIGYGKLEASPFVQEATQQSANLALALAGTGLPALAFFMAGLYRRREDDHHAPRAARDPISQPSGLHVITKTIDNTDHAAKEALARLRQCIQAAA